MQIPETYNLTQAAGRLGVSRRTVANYVRSGKLAALRRGSLTGTRWAIAVDAIERFKQSRS